MRELPQRTRESYAGSLLVAHPSMLDPSFRRAVLFISAHEANEGALGVILNRPLEKHVSELVNDLPSDDLADVPVFLGGPVGKDKLMFAAFEWQKGAGLKLTHDFGLEEASARVGSD